MPIEVVELEEYLAPVVISATQTLQIIDAMTDELVIEDPILQICARLAYSQIAGYLNRELILFTYTELYSGVEPKFRLRQTPVSSVDNVWDEDNNLLVVDTDYTVINNYINLKPDTSNYLSQNFTTGADEDHYNVIVEYGGGYDLSNTDHRLDNALILQTIANYNRKDHLGILKAQSPGSGAISMPELESGDSGHLVGTVKEILSPLVYYGPGETW